MSLGGGIDDNWDKLSMSPKPESQKVVMAQSRSAVSLGLGGSVCVALIVSLGGGMDDSWDKLSMSPKPESQTVFLAESWSAVAQHCIADSVSAHSEPIV